MENDSTAFRAVTCDQSSADKLSQKKIQTTWKKILRRKCWSGLDKHELLVTLVTE